MNEGENSLPFLCGHPAGSSARKSYKRVCGVCGSFWDEESLAVKIPARDDYSLSRFHYDGAVGKNKVVSLRRWLSALPLDLSGLNVCEVGFGGGWTLKFFHDQARAAYGIEALQSNIDFAAKMGVPDRRLFKFGDLPPVFPEKINLWVFQDSFEHIDAPKKFLDWVLANSDHPRVLIISPRADSISARIMGRYWPHKIADHKFHWSKKGIVGFFEGQNMRLQKTFFPLKTVSLKTALAHMGHKFDRQALKSLAGRIRFDPALPFNIGEMGLLFSEK
jgi:hypothetical protein